MVAGGRCAKAPPRDFRFLRGLLVVVEFVAPGNLSPRKVWCLVPGSRGEGTCTLHAFRAVFRCRLFLLAVCVDLVHQRFIFQAVTALVLDETSFWLRLEKAAIATARSVARLS